MIGLLFKQYKLYLYGALALAVCTALLASHWFMYNAGKDKVLASQAELLKEKDRRIVKLQTELEDEQEEIKIIYRDRIKTIRTAPDPTGCADTTIPDDILQQFVD